MGKDIDILDVLKWIALSLFVLVLLWYLFGHTPTLEQVFTVGATILFLFLALEGRASDKRQTEHHEEQTQILKSLLEEIKRR